MTQIRQGEKTEETNVPILNDVVSCPCPTFTWVLIIFLNQRRHGRLHRSVVLEIRIPSQRGLPFKFSLLERPGLEE